MRHVMLVNTFASVDDSLRDFMREFLKELSSDKFQDPEFAFYFFDYISVSTRPEEQRAVQAKKHFEQNPITVRGRTCLIQGVLGSVPLEKRIAKIYLPMYVVHSLTNCLVDIAHADKIEKVDLIGHAGIAAQEANLKRKVIYVEGGHSVFRDNPERMADLLNKFVLKK